MEAELSRSRSSVVAQSWLSRGSVVAQSWLSRGSVVAQSWLSRGSVVAQSWLSRGSVVAQSWLSRGWSWLSRGSVVASSGSGADAETQLGYHVIERFNMVGVGEGRSKERFMRFGTITAELI